MSHLIFCRFQSSCPPVVWICPETVAEKWYRARLARRPPTAQFNTRAHFTLHTVGLVYKVEGNDFRALEIKIRLIELFDCKSYTDLFKGQRKACCGPKSVAVEENKLSGLSRGATRPRATAIGLTWIISFPLFGAPTIPRDQSRGAEPITARPVLRRKGPPQGF